MPIQHIKIWVHGTSGQIQVDDPAWCSLVNPQRYAFFPYGWGMHLQGNAEDKDEKDWDPQNSNLPWFQFHIPTPSIEKTQLNEVMFRFATDCNPAQKNVGVTWNNATQTFDAWDMDAGGAIIKQVHVYDGDILLGHWDDLNWQSSDLNTDADASVAFEHPPQIRWGIGVSVRVWFKNQFYTSGVGSYGLGDVPDPSMGPIGGAGAVGAVRTDTKEAYLISIGCDVSVWS